MKLRPGYLKRILGGAIFGLYMGHLVFFLNPQIDLTVGRLALVASVYTVLWGLLLGTVLWLLRVARVKLFGRPPGDYRSHGFGYIVAAALISTATFWGHLAFFKVFLPREAVAALSNATTILGAASFLLLIVWLVEKKLDEKLPNGTLTLAVIIIALSVVILYQRRDRYPEPPDLAFSAVMTQRDTEPVTLVVVDDLPYDWVVTLEGEDLIPQLSTIIESGFFARVHPFNTSSARALSASLASGKLPNKHGVTGRWSYRTLLNQNDPWLNIPRSISFRNWGLIPPVERISAYLPSGSARPIWDMFGRTGTGSFVVNWPYTHGKIEPPTVGISDRACEDPVAATVDAIKGVLAGNCLDAERIDSAVTLRLEPLGVDSFDRIRRSLRSDRASAMTLLETREEGQLTLATVAINALGAAVDEVGVESNRLPPAGSVEGDSIRAVISQVDRLIGEIDRLREDDILIVVSASGPSPPPLPSNPVAAIRELFSTGVSPGREDGFVLMSGGVNPSREGAPIVSVVDIVPTALFAAGMPVARDLDGRVITEAFDGSPRSQRGVSYIQSYEKIEPSRP